jgi:signal transduction histidine kinase
VVHSRDEIGNLATRFNQMAERLEVSFSQLRSERDAMRRFIADASHELRTPVTALKNFNSLLCGPAIKDRAARAEFLAESQAQIERLEWITRNLLDLSRIDAGLVDLEMKDHSVAEILQAAAAPFHRLAAEKGVTLTVSPLDTSFYLKCDRLRLEMALSNLLDNAIKFTPAGGKVEIGAEQTPRGIRLWVKDDGPGVSPEDLPHIFERFYRGREHMQSGSGLGLSITESLVRLQGGNISVDSAPGQGACFNIEWILENNNPDDMSFRRTE